MASGKIAAKASILEVQEEISHSDHNYIEFTIKSKTPRPERKPIGWNLGSIDKVKLAEAIKNTSAIDTGTSALEGSKALTEKIVRILNEVTLKNTIMSNSDEFSSVNGSAPLQTRVY